MELTTNLKLKKPSYEDGADIAVINENMNVIDEQIENLGVQSLVNSGYYSTGTCSSIVRERLSLGFTTGRFSTSKLSDMPVGGIVVFYSHLAASSGVWCELYGSDGNIYTARINNNDGSYLVQWDLMTDKTQLEKFTTYGITSITNANDFPNGCCSGCNILNAPNTECYFFETYVSGEYGWQIAYLMSNAKNIYIRSKVLNWQSWEKILTDKQTDFAVLTLQNGWSGNLYFGKNQLNQLILAAAWLIPGTTAWGTTIGILPAGYRPLYNTPIDIYHTTGKVVKGLVVLSDGKIAIYNPGPTELPTSEAAMINSIVNLY